MSERPPDSDSGADANWRSTEDLPSGLPTWVKISAVIGILAVMIVAIVTLLGGVEHGPGLHRPAADNGDDDTTITGALRLPVEADEFAFEPKRVELASGDKTVSVPVAHRCDTPTGLLLLARRVFDRYVIAKEGSA
jgi:hypothetical protein